MDDTVYLELAFERAALDIRRVVHAIAGRYKARGLPLTWRLLHEIENEALADLGLAARHDAKLLDLFLRLAGSGYPDGDEPVHISSPRQIPLITWFALDVYGVGNDARSCLGAARKHAYVRRPLPVPLLMLVRVPSLVPAPKLVPALSLVLALAQAPVPQIYRSQVP